MFRLEIATDNDAFTDDNARAEVARILRRLADNVEAGATDGHVRDVNGNRVGTWVLEQ